MRCVWSKTEHGPCRWYNASEQQNKSPVLAAILVVNIAAKVLYALYNITNKIKSFNFKSEYDTWVVKFKRRLVHSVTVAIAPNNNFLPC